MRGGCTLGSGRSDHDATVTSTDVGSIYKGCGAGSGRLGASWHFRVPKWYHTAVERPSWGEPRVQFPGSECAAQVGQGGRDASLHVNTCRASSKGLGELRAPGVMSYCPGASLVPGPTPISRVPAPRRAHATRHPQLRPMPQRCSSGTPSPQRRECPAAVVPACMRLSPKAL